MCSLADLLSLNLHSFEDEVHNIVDKAIKEMAMERMLKELEITWSAMEFQHEPHSRTGHTLLRQGLGGSLHYFCVSTTGTMFAIAGRVKN